MPSFGEKLRREREKRSITLDQISQSTKIGTRMLQALEEDKFNQLPGGIFNKGFVRAYARHLGLDEDQTVAEYLEASGETPALKQEPPPQDSVRIIEASTDAPSRTLPWGLFAAILLLVALALSIWSHRQKKREAAATPAAANSQLVEGQPAATPSPAVTSAPNQKQVAPSPANPASNPPAPVKPTSSPVKILAAAASKTPPESGLPAAPGEFVVLIQAHEDSWTVITADGRTIYSGILAAGDQRAVHGHTQVVVKAGNAGGVELSFNGKKLQPQGDNGQVRVITFGPAGVVANTPSTPPSQ